LLNRRKELGLPQNEISKYFPSKTGGLTGCVSNWEKGSNVPTKEQWIILKRELKIETKEFNELIDRVEAERELIGKDGRPPTSTSIFGIGIGKWDYTKAKNKESKKWSGFKSFSLKPAVECVVVAQKPKSEKTIVGQVLFNGCGAVNVEACRIPVDETGLIKGGCKFKSGHFNNSENTMDSEYSSASRFPANLLVSEKNVLSKNGCMYDLNAWAKKRNITLTEDSMFFDVAKPSKAEKNLGLERMEEKRMNMYLDDNELMGLGGASLKQNVNQKTLNSIDYDSRKKVKSKQNFHPTTKPTKLFCYLSELFCQPSGVVLDPFMGSGTTGVACAKMNKKFIGIELNKEYFEIAKKRITEALKQTKLGENT